MSRFILGRHSGTVHRGIGFSKGRAASHCDEMITYGGEAHLVTFAPTGAGKTSGPVICNALKHEGQLIVIDIKGEVYAATAARRRTLGQAVHVLDLHDDGMPGSLNPLDLVARGGTDPAALGRSFAAELIERSAIQRDRFWDDWAETGIGGSVAWLLADCDPADRRLSKLFDLFSDDDVVYKTAKLLDSSEIKNRAAKAALSSMLQMPELTRGGVIGTIQSHLRLFDSDLSRRVTDTTSIDLDALIGGVPMSLYIIVPPDRLKAYRPILRMWLSGLLLALTKRPEIPLARTLMLCDEIGQLGRVDAFLMAASLMRSWGLTLWTFWQNVSQLQVYGEQANTLVDNAGVVQFFGPRNRRLAQELCALVGGVDADAMMRMAADEQMLLIDGQQMRCRQVRFYQDAEFASLYEQRNAVSR
jgi:type IV secretion system protein VirD4